jgi:hypothetical protein
VRRVQYRAGRDGRVRAVTTGRLPLPTHVRPQQIAQHSIFSGLGRLPPVRTRRFDAFWDVFS